MATQLIAKKDEIFEVDEADEDLACESDSVSDATS